MEKRKTVRVLHFAGPIYSGGLIAHGNKLSKQVFLHMVLSHLGAYGV